MAMTLNSEEQARVNNVYNEREKALAESNSMYEGLINQAGSLRDQQNAYLAQQEQIQNNQVDVNLEKQKQLIDKQKEDATRSKEVEERKALNTYMAFTNPYGAQANNNYARGLANSGVSATERVGALTSYNDRVARANTNLQNAITEYDLSYQQALKDGDVQKAQNALNKLQLELQNNQDYYNNVANLNQNRANTANSIKNAYMDQYNTVYSQILKEQAQAEANRQWQAEYNLSKKAYNNQKNYLDYTGGGNSYDSLINSGYDDTEYSQQYNPASVLNATKSGSLSLGGLNWYANTFNKHSYQKKDLDYVLKNAVNSGKITKDDAVKIYNSYGIYS